MQRLGDAEGVRLTSAGNLNRRFVEDMLGALQWPHWKPERLLSVTKVVNERDVLPLHFVRILLSLAGLARKYRSRFRLTRKAKPLIEPEAAGRLNALLFTTTFTRYNLAYMDMAVAEDEFAPQSGLILYLLGKVGGSWRSADELVRATTLPLDPRHPYLTLGLLYRSRVLRYLECFGLVERSAMAANDDWRNVELFRITPLYERLLTFAV